MSRYKRRVRNNGRRKNWTLPTNPNTPTATNKSRRTRKRATATSIE